MREHVRPLLSLALLLCMAGCVDPESDLRLRAEQFGELLLEIATLSETTATVRLERFLEPSPELEARAAEYYADFAAGTEKFTVTSQSIAALTLSDDETTGTVSYKTVVRLKDGREMPVLQETSWILVDGTWYRSLEESAKKFRR